MNGLWCKPTMGTVLEKNIRDGCVFKNVLPPKSKNSHGE